MAEHGPDLLQGAAPAYDDVEAKRARAGVAAALFGGSDDEHESERVAVGRYEISSRLGAGGMGVVYRAHDPDLDRPVAVKLLHTDSAADEKARARMLREARALAKLSHPNVITVYDVGTDDGQVFVAMELVSGRDLRRWLEQRRAADWREVLELFIAAGRGLAAAHEVALVHRDFKPENVLVGDDGRVRVLDFGLARLHRPVDAETDGAAGSSTDGDDRAIAQLPTAQLTGGLTETGTMIGTPLYMAPELYAGKAADERSDQFAFCASLYEGVYRQLPFGSRTLAVHIDAVAAGRVVAPPDDSPVPVVLWQLIARGLDPDPLARHADMHALLAALERVANEPAVTELPSGGSSFRWFSLVLVVLLAVTGLVGLELGWFGGAEAPSELPPTDTNIDVDEPARANEPGPAAPRDDHEPAAVVPPLEVVEPAVADETGTETGETGDAVEAEPTVASPPATSEPDVHGWCHLHEDHFTLLDRSNKRRARFVRDGQCYQCRVESRSSRTRNFSPRDCEGYSLCGPAREEECR